MNKSSKLIIIILSIIAIFFAGTTAFTGLRLDEQKQQNKELKQEIKTGFVLELPPTKIGSFEEHLA